MSNSIQVMQDIIAGYQNNPKWNNSPLGEIKTLSNTHVGKVGQDFVKEWCKQLVSCIQSSPDYFEACRADWKRVFYSILRIAKAAVGNSYPTNYGYTTLGMEWKCAPSEQSPWDARIEGVTFEVKTATEDISGNFQFNHIRHHRTYQAVLCLGIAPDAVLFHAWRKGDVAEGLAGNLVTMDAGSSATFKLTRKRRDLLPIEQFRSRIESITASVKSL